MNSKTNHHISLIIFVFNLVSTLRCISGIPVYNIPPGNPSPAHDFHEYSGKLSVVVTDMTGEAGEYRPSPDGSIIYDSFVYITSEECCVFGDIGRKPVFRESSSSITYNFDPSIHLPTWADYDTYGQDCPTAGTAWDDFYKKTSLHEQEHSYYANVTYSSYSVASALADVQPSNGDDCVTLESYDTVAQFMMADLMQQISSANNKLLTEYTFQQDGVDIRTGVAIRPDITQDCPPKPFK